MPSAQPDVDEVVILSSAEAYLVVHVLAVFERLLRRGELTPAQLREVTGVIVALDDRADVEMAEVVSEAAVPLRRQL